MWKSALFRVSHMTLSSRLLFPLDFRPADIRFLHTPIPSGIVVFFRLPYLLRGTQRAYQVPLVIDTNELSILLYSDGYMGYHTTGMRFSLSYPL